MNNTVKTAEKQVADIVTAETGCAASDIKIIEIK